MAAAGASSSSTSTSTSSRNVQRRSHSGSTSSSSARNTGHSGGRRRGNSSIMRRESFLEGERAALPEIGERTIFVTDEGLIDSGEFDEQYQSRGGLFPDEQQELSEVFKVRIGLATADRDQVDRMTNEIDSAMSLGGQRRDDAIQRNRMVDFAARHFQQGSPPMQFTRDKLRRPLLAKSTTAERRASLAVWVAILRFTDEAFARKSSGTSKPLEAPIISQVWDLLEAPDQSTQQSGRLERSWSSPADGVVHSGERRLSLKGLFKTLSTKSAGRQSQRQRASTSQAEPGSDEAKLLTSRVIAGIPSSEIDLANYIVAHGILSKELRDEIYCQLCCVVTNNPSVESRKRGWMLHLLCAGCFLPSIKFLSYYYAFLYEVAVGDDQRYANFTRRTLRRTNSNGMRFHPPSSVELASAKSLRPMNLDVEIPDGRCISVSVDSASTSSEMCDMIAANINVKDSFGFSLHVTIEQKVSSMGSGMDHIMDAITECEQMVRCRGRPESTASWRLMYRKELFTPWYNPSLDEVATELIYHQIVDCVYNDEYRLHNDDIITYVARCLYVDCGRYLQLDVAKSKMCNYFPRSYMDHYGAGSKARDGLARAVMASFEKQGFSGYAVPAKYMQQELVASASTIWPLHFSAMFEAYRVDGPPLPHDDIILAINSCGVFMLNSRYDVVVGFHFYDVINVKADTSMGEIRNASIELLAVDGAEFKLLCPNSETVERIIAAFLEGLRRRSRWAIALDQSIVPVQDLDLVSSSSRLYMKAGDLVELLDADAASSPSTSSAAASCDVELLRGRNEETGKRGSFSASCVYILPTVDKPTPDFVSLLKAMTRETMEALPHPRRQLLAIQSSAHGVAESKV